MAAEERVAKQEREKNGRQRAEHGEAAAMRVSPPFVQASRIIDGPYVSYPTALPTLSMMQHHARVENGSRRTLTNLH